jgi:DNA-directed DNA polymerase III PolC
MRNFVHLNVHSSFSFHEGASTIESLVARAAEMGMTHLALTDSNGMYGIVPFVKTCRKYGITPIPGVEINPNNSNTTSAERSNGVVLLAKSFKGYGELCRIVTRSKLEDDFDLETQLSDLSEDVFVLTSDPGLLERLHKQLVPGQVFGEVQAPGDEGTPAPTAKRGLCLRFARWCRERGIPIVATNRVVMAEPEQYGTHVVLQAIGNNSTMDAMLGKTAGGREHYLKSAEQMAAIFREAPDALENTVRIAEQCNVDLRFGELKFPKFGIPDAENSFEYLKALAYQGLRERYGDDPPEEARSRLNYELGIIDHLGFTEYFLVVYDIAREARARDIPTIGRGSAANSIVSYCLKLTHVCPLKLNLFFERFLNPERKSPPDIDLDFSWQQRDDIINYVYKKYGRDRVAMISTMVTFQGRSAIHEVAKTMGIPEREITAITSRISSWGTHDLAALREKNPECRNLPLDQEPWASVIGIGQHIIGFPRHLSIHPGGIVISPGPITDWTALERSTKGFVVTQYDMHPIEDLGLVKIDLLSQRSLGVYRDTLAQIRDQGKPCPPTEDLEAILADEDTLSTVREGRTMGCFYIESPGMQALLQKLRVDTFEMLVAASSVIRPGVSESGMMTQYIDSHRDVSKIVYLHPIMEEVLGETYGVMIYQEDVIKVAHRMAGMSLGEADLIRRAMSGKERSPEGMRKLRDRFIRSSVARGVDEWIAREVWRQIESFAGYAFCKAHSASFAVLSFQVAYLKAHYPAEFMAAVLSNQGGYFGPSAYIEEARRLGIRILPPDINDSVREYRGRDSGIRMGLMAIGHLTEESIRNILEERRRHGPYSSLHDFHHRVRLSPTQEELLVKCGAMDCFKSQNCPSRPALLWMIRAANRQGTIGTARTKDMDSLFDTTDYLEAPFFPEYDQVEQFYIEKEIFGFPVTTHPLDFVDVSQRKGIVSSLELAEHRGRQVRMIGWAISSKRIKTRATQAYMKFLSLEDGAGTFEVTIFPKVYDRFADQTLGKGPFLVSGTVEEDHGVVSLVAQHIEQLKVRTLQQYGKNHRRRRDSYTKRQERFGDYRHANRAIIA